MACCGLYEMKKGGPWTQTLSQNNGLFKLLVDFSKHLDGLKQFRRLLLRCLVRCTRPALPSGA